MEQNSVLWENEIKANKTLVFASLLSFFVMSVLMFMVDLEVLEVEGIHYRLITSLNLILLLFVSLVARLFHFNRRWIKYMLLITLIIVFAAMNALFTYYTFMLTAIPLALSCLYYSPRLTVIIAVISSIMFTVATIYGAGYGLLDLNFLEFPKGTVIEMGDNTWLSDAVENMYYDPDLMMKNMITYSLSVHLFLSLIIITVCIGISLRGREVIYQQKLLTEQKMHAAEELNMARSIQANSLPGRFPAFPQRKEFDIRAVMQPAREVGGDFYDFFLVDDDRLAMVVADVSEKGVPAALYMMTAKTMIKTHTMIDPDPARVLRAVNARLAKENEEDMFVTAWLGIFTISTGKLVYADAGHEKLLVKSGDDWRILPKQFKCMPLAMLEEEELVTLPEEKQFHNSELFLSPGDVVCQYSDGVTEATDNEGAMFGEERLLQAVKDAETSDPEKIMAYVKRSIEDFVQGAPQYDDVTMLTMLYRGTE